MNAEQTSVDGRVAVHAALADPTRLRVVDLLSHRDASASEVGTALGVPSNLLAHHLGVLERAGLVTRHRSEGDRRRTYLCLDGPRAHLAGTTAPEVVAGRILFVCTANTARSHLAAALWRRESGIDVASAGTEPGERINPGAVDAAARHGIDLPEVSPRALDTTLTRGDVVITVCDRAHEQVGATAWGHWSVPDPVAVGTPAAFDRAVSALSSRVRALAPVLLPA